MTAKLAKALSLFQGELKPIPKDAENPFFHSAYSSLTACWELVRPLLLKHGLAVTQLTAVEQGEILLVTKLMHESGEEVVGIYPIYCADKKPQSLGSAISYAKRYSLQAILGLASEDDDAEGATHHGKPPHNTVPTQKTTRLDSGNTPGYEARHAAKMDEFISEKQIGLMMAVSYDNGWTDDDVKEYWKKLGIHTRKEVKKFQLDKFLENVKKFPKPKEPDFVKGDDFGPEAA